MVLRSFVPTEGMFTELDIACSISTPGNRGCMDRKGKKMQNDWPQAEGRSVTCQLLGQIAPQGYIRTIENENVC
jgi:hypothetical protein